MYIFQMEVEPLRCKNKENPDTCSAMAKIRTPDACKVMMKEGFWSGSFRCIKPEFFCPIKKVKRVFFYFLYGVCD